MYKKVSKMFLRRFLKNANTGYYCTSGVVKAFKRSKRFVIEKHKNTDLLTTILQDRKMKSPEDWIKVRKEILDENTNITSANIDAMMLGFYTTKQNYEMAKEYVKFLKNSGEMNLATIGKYFRLFYLMNVDKSIPEIEEDNLLKMYDDTRTKYQILDSLTLENFIEGFSITRHWKICLDLLKEIKLTNAPSFSAYNAVAATLFSNGEEENAWNILKELLENNRSCKNSTFIAYMRYLDRHLGKKESIIKGLEKFFVFLQQHDIKCDLDLIQNIENFLKKHNITAHITTASSRGQCKNCNQLLKKFDLTEKEFNDLRRKIIDNVIVGRDIFNKSSPEELNIFKEFINKGKKYDVVIDGLNVAYSAGTKQSPKFFSSLIHAVVNHFKQQNKKILLLGRSHMDKWPNFRNLHKATDIFLATDLSQDDPYLLYCALSSGKNTIIVSRDLMRSHTFLLQHYQLKIAFNRWLSQRLYQLKYADDRGTVVFKMPRPFTTTPQKIDNNWHIPYDIDEDDSIKYKRSDTSWLCIQL